METMGGAKCSAPTGCLALSQGSPPVSSKQLSAGTPSCALYSLKLGRVERNIWVRSGVLDPYLERAEPAIAGSIQIETDLLIKFSGMEIF